MAESLGGGAVAQDQGTDRAGVIGRIQRLGNGIEDARMTRLTTANKDRK